MAPKAGAVTGTGIVEAAPPGKTIMIARGKNTTTVDASSAKLRYNGKFFALDKLTAGSIVSAKGELSGTTLKATEITVSKLSGAAPKKDTGGKMGSGKMNKMDKMKPH